MFVLDFLKKNFLYFNYIISYRVFILFPFMYGKINFI